MDAVEHRMALPHLSGKRTWSEPMSRAEYRGAAYAIQQLMESAKRDIDSGARKGATVLHAKSNPAKTHIGWFKRRILRGEFRKRA